jgi:hypothetical protein
MADMYMCWNKNKYSIHQNLKTMHCYNHTALADTDIHAYIYSRHEDITGIHFVNKITSLAYIIHMI